MEPHYPVLFWRKDFKMKKQTMSFVIIMIIALFILIDSSMKEKTEESSSIMVKGDYEEAFSYEKKGNLEEARVLFERYILTNGELIDEATIHLARINSASNNAKEAINNYMKIKRDSPLYELSRNEALQTAIDGNEYQIAIKILDELFPSGSNDKRRRQYLSKIPPSLWDTKEAESIRNSVLRGNFRDEPFMLRAVRHYSDKLHIPFSEDLTYNEGKELYFSGHFKDALEALGISSKSENTQKKQESAFLMARCYYRMGEYKRAAMLFEEVRNIKPESFLAMKAWFLEGRLLTFFLRDKRCLAVLSDFIRHNSTSSLKPFAELYRAQFLYSDGKKDKAIEILKNMNNGGGSSGLFVRAGMTAYICGDISLADSLLQKASQKGAFFRGWIRLRNGDTKGAEILFSQVKSGLLYPKLSRSSGKLKEGLQALSAPSERTEAVPENLPHPLNILILCGDWEMIPYQINAIKNMGNLPYGDIKKIEDKIKSISHSLSLDTSSERYSSSNPYPLYRWSITCKESKNLEVDPFLALAISREESHFNEGVISNRGAIGVMQVMPELAKSILQKEGKGFVPSMLRDPGLCMHIGIKNLSELLKHYNNNAFFTVASYNGGQGTIDIWLDFFKVKEPVIFLGLIPFDETQGYVEKVLDSYMEYQERYGITESN